MIAGILFYIFLWTKLKRDYSEKKVVFPPGRSFFVPLVVPKNYFKKGKLWQGWIFYFLSHTILFAVFYFFFKLIGVIK